MGSGGGGTTSSIQDVPREFKPAFTQLFNSALGAARTSAGQPGFGTLGVPGGASQTANFITGFGGMGAPNPYAPPGFGNPYQSAFPSPFAAPQGGFVNTPTQPGVQGGGGKAEGFQGFPAPAAQQQGQPFGVQQPQVQSMDVTGQQAPPVGTSPQDGAAPGGKLNPQQGQQGGIFQPFMPPPETGPQANYPGSLAEGTVGANRQGRPSTQIPLAAGPPIVGQPFGEQFTAGTSPLEFESLAQREAVARQLQGIGNPLMNLGVQTARGDFLHPGSNPYLQAHMGAALRPITQEFTQSVLPQFNSQAIASGAFGGSSARDLAFNQLASGFGQQLADTGSRIAYENLARERQLQQGAGQLLDQAGLLNQLTPELLAQVGLGQRELAQRPLDEALLQFQESINAPFRPLFPLASIIQGGDIGSAFSTTVPTPSALSTGLVGALGGAGAGSQLAGQMDFGNLGTGLSTGLGALLGGLGGGLA